jgi:cephalosporin-C deacetylase-like acetyl esterase
MQSKTKKLYQLFGDLPSRDLPIQVELVNQEKHPSYCLERLVLNCNGIEKVPALFVYPKVQAGKLPVVVYNHSHGGRYETGKEELIVGAPYIYKPWLNDLITAGYAVIAIDHWGFGQRSGRSEMDIFKDFLWHGKSMWGMMVYDSLRAVDYLCSRAEIDQTRIATLGMSMGSTMAWYLAAIDERVKVCVDICCLTDFHSLLKHQGLHGHGIYYYVPGLLKFFDTAAINALIALRAHLSLAGIDDLLTPEDGLDIIDNKLKKVYRRMNSAENWQLHKFPVGHLETCEMRNIILNFIANKL